MRRALLFALLAVTAAACVAGPRPRRFELTGQVLAVPPASTRITVRHQDIPGFMPAMTMSFRVDDAKVRSSLAPGDLIRATLVVTDDDAYLAAIERTGHAGLSPMAAPRPPAVDPLKPGDAVPDAKLVDQDGRPFALSSLAGSAIVVTFIYTRCPLPDYCPLMDRNFAALQRAVKAGGVRGVQLLSISFDPTFDTPAVLKAHAGRTGADPAVWRFLTGDPATIDTLGARFGLTVVRDGGDPAALTHNLRTAVIDRHGNLKKIYDGNDWTPPEVLADLASMSGS